MVLGASTQTMVLVVVVPFVVWGLAVLIAVLRRRRKVSLPAGRESGLISDHVPEDRPLATVRGGANVGGLGASWPFAVMDLHASALVIRSPQSVFRPMVLSRGDIGQVRIVKRVVSAGLKVFDVNGVEIDFVFFAFGPGTLRRALSSAGWIGLLEPGARSAPTTVPTTDPPTADGSGSTATTAP